MAESKKTPKIDTKPVASLIGIVQLGAQSPKPMPQPKTIRLPHIGK